MVGYTGDGSLEGVEAAIYRVEWSANMMLLSTEMNTSTRSLDVWLRRVRWKLLVAV